MPANARNTWQQPSPMPIFPTVESKTAAEIAGYATPVAGMLLFDSTNSKLCVYTGAAWETITSV